MSASKRFLFRGFKILNFSLKVPIIIGSFMRVSTVDTRLKFSRDCLLYRFRVEIASVFV